MIGCHREDPILVGDQAVLGAGSRPEQDAQGEAHGTHPKIAVASGRQMGGAMVNVVITGAAGFLGSRLARELLAAGSLGVAGGQARPLSRMTLVDQAPVPPDLAADERVTAVRGDLTRLLDPAADGPDVLATGGLRGEAEVVF